MNCTFECFIEGENASKSGGMTIIDYERALNRNGKKSFGEGMAGNSSEFKGLKIYEGMKEC